jgi:hypothetical protein
LGRLPVFSSHARKAINALALATMYNEGMLPRNVSFDIVSVSSYHVLGRVMLAVILLSMKK